MDTKQNPRSRVLIRLEALYRKVMLRLFHGSLPIILVTEYPKSGASWLAQMLGEVSGYPFPRQQFPRFGKAIYHGHYIDRVGNGPTIVVWRDPRDIMVSWYYHTMFVSDRNHPEFVEQYRSALAFADFDDIQSNLPEFIDFNFRSPLSPRFSFNDFFDAWHGRADVVYCRYEDLNTAPADTLARVSSELGFVSPEDQIARIVDRYSFRKQASRPAGTENKGSYLRKGIVGDWQNHFSAEARRVFHSHIGKRLIQLGYEKDDAWVTSPPSAPDGNENV